MCISLYFLILTFQVAANCATSYVQIQSGIAATDDRFCGELLSGAAAGTLAGIVESK